MLSQEQIEHIEYCRKNIISEIQKTVLNADKFQSILTLEGLIPIIYLKTCYSYLQEKKFENLEESWRFMNEIKGIFEKISFVNHYILRLQKPF